MVGVVSPRVGHVVKHVVRVEVEPLCNLLQPRPFALRRSNAIFEVCRNDNDIMALTWDALAKA